MTGPKTVGNAACHGIEVLRYTVFWLKCFLNDGPPQPKIVGNAACYGIEVLRYTVLWLKCFLNDGGSLTQNRRKETIFFILAV